MQLGRGPLQPLPRRKVLAWMAVRKVDAGGQGTGVAGDLVTWPVSGRGSHGPDTH